VEEFIFFPYQDNEYYLRVMVTKVDWAPSAMGDGWTDVEINGKPAWVFDLGPIGTRVVWSLPSGHCAQLEFGFHPGREQLKSGEMSAPDPVALRPTAMRIASSLRESSNNLRVGFAATYLPAGQRIIGVERLAAEPPGFGRILTAGVC